MRATVLRMLSTNSLTAFSSSNATAPLNRSSGARLARMVEAPPASRPSPSGAGAGAAIGTGRSPPPGQVLPRGSLLNLQV